MKKAESTAHHVKWLCTTIAKHGFNIGRGVLWQNNRRNARAYHFPTGRLLAEQRQPSGFQTDALYLYPDRSMLLVSRTLERTKLAAIKG
jgi:hypothetical protein